MTTAPPLSGERAAGAPARPVTELFREGFTVLRAADFHDRLAPGELVSLQALWDTLVLDETLGSGSTYRYRRYGRLQATATSEETVFTPLAHTLFVQSAEHNPMHMGRARDFAPIAPADLVNPALLRLLDEDLRLIRAGDDRRSWEIGLHLVRTVAGSSPGLPTPEGRHRDGHDYIGMHLLRRRDCLGGESIVYREGLPDARLTLLDPLDAMVVIDAEIMHEATPVTAVSGEGVRDMLLADFNALGPSA